MITVNLVLGIRGNLIAVDAAGHSGAGKRGTDIVCAAVSVLLRTTLQVLAEHSDSLIVKSKAPERGVLAFRVNAFTETDLPFLQYAAIFLREGLDFIAKEFPQAVKLEVEQYNE